ncbi:cation transporter [Mollicutes bacterium LVI A0078]|nr:cation transporter [Mollicutes bacterium LVI A0075]WOO91548.1 cation transporter [Mollicutes bacterium LVI A0078]
MDTRKIIGINLVFVLIMAISGIYFGVSANSKALLTDGVVSLVIFSSSSLGILIHSILNHNDDYLYPFGKWRFEYVYNFIRLMILTTIIVYSLFEATHTIYSYIALDEVQTTITLNAIILYFPLKLSAAIASLVWLRIHKQNLDDEYYAVERDSVLVDTVLTIAILIGFAVLTRIELVKPVADSITLLIISVILLITIFSELKHLIFILIGRRIYTDLEQIVYDNIPNNFNTFDVHIEKFGIVYIVFVTCSYNGSKTVTELEALESLIGTVLENNNVTRYRIELNFKN